VREQDDSRTKLISLRALCKFSIRKITPPSTPTSPKRAYRSMVCWISPDPFQVPESNAGILNNTRTTLGRNLLREWLLRPSLSLSVIAARYSAVACFVDPDNITTADDIQGHLSGIKNTPRVLKMLKSGKGKVKDWQGLVEVRTRCCCVTCTPAYRTLKPTLDQVRFSCRNDP